VRDFPPYTAQWLTCLFLEVQSRGLVAKTDEGYQRAVVEQARNLRAFLEPSQHTQPSPHPQASTSFQLSQPLDSSWASEGFVATQMEDNKAITRDVIKWLCRDEVIFQHMKNPGDPTKLRSVKGILQRFKEKGYLNDQGARFDALTLVYSHLLPRLDK
jgi:hypothetical protein